jgi:uncharacterized membrane protein ArfC
MHHVHWWLFTLSFFIGLGLTFALLAKGNSSAKSESPTTKIRAPKETPTTKIPVAIETPTTEIPVAIETPTTKIPVVPYAPYGPGSARAGAEGSGPAGWLVKGRSDTRLYYTPDDATYDRTVAQVWFKDEESAMQAYFTPWRKSSRK